MPIRLVLDFKRYLTKIIDKIYLKKTFMIEKSLMSLKTKSSTEPKNKKYYCNRIMKYQRNQFDKLKVRFKDCLNEEDLGCNRPAECGR